MNISTYIFGSLVDGYSQYPSDYTQTVFQRFYSESIAPTQIAVHREDKLIYYGYIRKLNARQYIGLCVVLNSIMLTDFKEMFNIFENTITALVVKGEIIQFDDKGDIISKVTQLHTHLAEVCRIIGYLRTEFAKLEATSKPLPAISYGIAKNEKRSFSIDNNTNDDIVEASASYNYSYVSKEMDFDTHSLSSYRGIVHRLNKEKSELSRQCAELKSQNSVLRNKQRNTLWTGILSVIIAILGGILYFKVINPSEVTRYQTGDFVYYGPLKNNKPHGTGVAIYPNDDKDGRRYYIGNFVNGERQDTAAILFYQDGDYYYGAMDGDEWDRGILYMNSDNSHFIGSFKNNEPYNGKWFDHKELYRLNEGKKVYSKPHR